MPKSKVTEGEKQLIKVVVDTIYGCMDDKYSEMLDMVRAHMPKVHPPRPKETTREGVLCPLRNWAPCLVGCASWDKGNLPVGAASGVYSPAGCRNPNVVMGVRNVTNF